MNRTVFGQTYADQYDLLYQNKNYEEECNLVEEVFHRYATGPVSTILDLGCGTGNHAIALARRGYQVTGVDRSAEMLAHAREKTATLQLPEGGAVPRFIQGDVRSLDLGRSFDAVLMMFAVLGYQLTNDEVLAALRTVQQHLKSGGLFICDVWYGPAVLAIRPSDRVKVMPTADGQLIRAASGVLDTYRHLCEVRYQFWRLRERRVVGEGEESHQVRYFFPQELALFMAHEQMALLDIRTFGKQMLPPGEDTWNVLAIGKALSI